MKKNILLFLAMLLPLMASAQTLIDGIYYNFDTSAKTAAVSHKDGEEYSGFITIPETVTYDDVTYSVTEIEPHAFFGCSGLTSIILPNSITAIGEYSFSWCAAMPGITIPGSVKEIGANAFYGCTGLVSVTIGDGVTTIGYGAFYGCSSITELSIPNSVISIGGTAFNECSALKSVTIPSSVTSIDSWAFSFCSALISISIPKSVTSIGECVFGGCTSLTSIVVESGNPKYDSRDNCNAVIETGTNTLVAGCYRTVIPSSVMAIGNYAFAYHTEMPSVTIPGSVMAIGGHAFAGCSGFTSVTLPNSVVLIGESAFRDCTGLTSFTVPDGVTKISNLMFYECTNMTSITMPGSITSVGRTVFGGCTALTDVYCYAEAVPQTDKYVFDRVKLANATLHVQEASIEAYSTVTPWKDFSSIIAIENIEPEVKKCAMPMIAFFGGKLIIRCKTEGVKYVCNLEFETDGNNVSLPEKVKISVYATKEGYEPSDVLTQEIDPRLIIGKLGDLNQDGTVDVGDIITITNIMAGYQ